MSTTTPPTTSPPLPVVGVMPTRFADGINKLDDEADPLEILPINEALAKSWDTDAHFTIYRVIGNGQDAWPRINKAAIGHLREAGADLISSLIVLDIDNTGHEAWTQASLASYLEKLQCSDHPLAWAWHAMYTSRKGMRLIFLLDREIRVDEIESRIRWVIREFENAGLKPDPLWAWNYGFRLPKVLRDGQRTETDQFYMFIEQWHQPRVPVESLGTLAAMNDPRAAVNKYAAPIVIANDSMPDPDEARKLCHTFTAGEWRRTDWYRKAKHRLKGREPEGCLFNNQPLAAKGSRDETLHKYLGCAVSCLMDIEGTTREHVFGLFVDPVQQLESDAQTPDWLAVLWSGIKRLWGKEESKRESDRQRRAAEAKVVEERQAAATMNAEQLCVSLLTGVRKWCKDASFLYPPAGVNIDLHQMEWICRRLVVSHVQSVYLMRPDGYYDQHAIQPSQLIPRLRITGLDKLVETERPAEGDTRMVDIPVSQIINRHATIVHSVDAVPQGEGGTLRNADMAGASLVVPAYRRNAKLTPQFNADVDEWLKHTFGEHYSEINHWIAWALAFEEGPICALSIEADPGVGKKMLVRGLAECLEVPAFATAHDLTSQYQYGILSSPFLVVNEGWPPKSGGKHPADFFREIVAGDTIEINRRYKDPVKMSNPMRVIFSANNASVVQMLSGGKDLSPEDRAALAIRLKHVKIGGEGAMWLRLRGGRALTAKPGARWIEGDAKEPSDYLLARHFLWLHANRRGPLGSRLLVEGDQMQQVIEQMRVNAGSTPLVVECLIKMIEQGRTNRDGLIIHEGDVWVTASDILDFFRSTISATAKGENLTLRKINEILKSLVSAGDTGMSYEHPQRPNTRRAWRQIDIQLIQLAAQRDGWANERISKIYAEKIARMTGHYKPRQAEVPSLDALKKRHGLKLPLQGDRPSIDDKIRQDQKGSAHEQRTSD